MIKEALSLVDKFKRLIQSNKTRQEESVSIKSQHEQNLIKGKKRSILKRKHLRQTQKASRIRNRNN